ncbi:kinetochore complex Fta4 of Sim4 subunit, or CENP-50-domain-containing protein [Coniochaeta sp. 2T2.1]|nr:kinetochore complex Fta4 of Sim4 subunit, or CENP-50-domain-containing protein [Coniochaeta sp. 2T2.1]
MAEPPQTVLAQKSNFLILQTRLLSQPIAPSRSWRRANDEADDGLAEKAVDDALFRLNHLLQQHSRRVHAPQATRHVAEQIDRLYWHDAERTIEREAEGYGLKVNDLTESEAIDSLPPTWLSEREAHAYPMEARRYADFVSRLQELNERKNQAESTVARLRQMKALLEPFQADEDGRGVQENLVTRDGEVEKELERMRMLLARVGGRVGHLLDQSGGGRGGSVASDLFGGDGTAMMVDDVEVEESRKVNDLLGRF